MNELRPEPSCEINIARHAECEFTTCAHRRDPLPHRMAFARTIVPENDSRSSRGQPFESFPQAVSHAFVRH